MKALKCIPIPDKIREIEYSGKISDLQYYKNLNDNAHINEAAYIDAFTAMLQFDEAATSKRIAKFDLQNVQLVLHSMDERIFKIDVS